MAGTGAGYIQIRVQHERCLEATLGAIGSKNPDRGERDTSLRGPPGLSTRQNGLSKSIFYELQHETKITSGQPGRPCFFSFFSFFSDYFFFTTDCKHTSGQGWRPVQSVVDGVSPAQKTDAFGQNLEFWRPLCSGLIS